MLYRILKIGSYAFLALPIAVLTGAFAVWIDMIWLAKTLYVVVAALLVVAFLTVILGMFTSLITVLRHRDEAIPGARALFRSFFEQVRTTGKGRK